MPPGNRGRTGSLGLSRHGSTTANRRRGSEGRPTLPSGYTENPARQCWKKPSQIKDEKIGASLYTKQSISVYVKVMVTGGFMAKRAAIYVRVSTDKQTVENQIRELRQIAERR